MIKGYPSGYNLTLLDAQYHFPEKVNEKSWTKGAMTLLVRDLDTNQKFHYDIENPDYIFFKAKDDVVIDHNEFFINRNNAEAVKVPYRDLEKTIAEITDNTEMYYDNIRSGNRRANKILHTHPRIFLSDSNIEDHYRFRFNNFYKNDTYKVTKAFFDIEADTKNMAGDFPMPGECPINAVSLVNLENHMVYSFLLRNSENPLIEDFETSIGPDLFKELKDFVIESCGGKAKAKKYGIDKLGYQFLFFDDEVDMIRQIFNYVNTLQPDFLLAWNMAFDIPYIIQRLYNLGVDPRDVICHPDFKYKEASYIVDERTEDMAERGDFAKISAYTVYLDQMIQYASVRKSAKALASYSLDYVGDFEAGIHKLDYSHITTDISELPYKDYKTFVFYNIMDTIVQVCIEARTNDVDFIFAKAIANNTRYAKVHRQTVYLANRGAQEFYSYGYIIGNNTNKFNEKPKEKFPGAFVALPGKASDYSKFKINNQPVNIYDLLIDFDYARLYPSITQEINGAPNTIIGKLMIDEMIYEKENQYKMERFDRGAKFLEDMQPNMWLEFCERYFKAAGYSDLLKDIEEYFTTKEMPSKGLHLVNDKGLINLVSVGIEDKFMKPVFVGNEDLIRPILKFPELDISKLDGKIDNTMWRTGDF